MRSASGRRPSPACDIPPTCSSTRSARARASAGVARRRLADAWPRTTFASDDPRAMPLYLRAGMRPWWPLTCTWTAIRSRLAGGRRLGLTAAIAPVDATRRARGRGPAWTGRRTSPTSPRCPRRPARRLRDARGEVGGGRRAQRDRTVSGPLVHAHAALAPGRGRPPRPARGPAGRARRQGRPRRRLRARAVARSSRAPLERGRPDRGPRHVLASDPAILDPERGSSSPGCL